MTTPRIIGLTILAVVALLVSIKRKSKPAIADDPNAYMPIMAAEAVKYAAAHGKSLDYTPESIASVESLLADLHQLRQEGHLPDRQLNVHAHQFGAYIGEVLRRKYGGHWTQDHEAAGPKSYPIHWKGGQSFPVGWCGKRILNGDEDNVWFKYQVITSEEHLHAPDT